ncbi:F-box/LRR-repeat protein [Camellia lanceoleosa]|uniref:F-box/LRR-repeat protein n=1 Tax=Camellia lanceoleosa TaxID=1840588 RepID=A0ACC0F7B5_9ERIC|nr:F-box/LRR-repeat protein [Camellia lanceoleosa]
MEFLPVEVIGNILSRLGAARDVVIASATCRKWREASRKHLQTLSFSSDDWPVYRDLSRSRLEILITQTIFQTTGLQGLYIFMDDVDEFSASTVIAWLIISALDLNLLLAACPNIEYLALVNPEIAMSDAQVTVDLNSLTLKSIYVEAISLDKFILEADSLESLHLKDCALELFELVGKGTLKHFKIDDVSVIQLDIGEAVENLENVDVSNFTIVWSKFYQMISKASKLRRLRLWDVVFDDEDEIVDLETIALCFPQLSHLALSYDLRDGLLHYGLQGSSHLENVIVLELGWTVVNDLFTHWVSVLLKRCPNLKKLVIHGIISEAKTHEECQMLANFTSSIVQLMRKYMHVDVQFEYE